MVSGFRHPYQTGGADPRDGRVDTETVLASAVTRERDGHFAEARATYDTLIPVATRQEDWRVLAEALRRRAVLAHQAGESALARASLDHSHATAMILGDNALAAQALNCLGGVELETGALEEASQVLNEAAGLAQGSPAILAKVEQNLGIVANIRGDYPAARQHYEQSLAAWQRLGDTQGCAIAHHNLGMLIADHGQPKEADEYFDCALQLAREIDDMHLQVLCLMNRAEVQLTLGRPALARTSAETAAYLAEVVGARSDTAELQLVLARCDRADGQPQRAMQRLRRAQALAEALDAPLTGAEATRELARLARDLGQPAEARSHFMAALDAFSALGAEADAAKVRDELAALAAPLTGTP